MWTTDDLHYRRENDWYPHYIHNLDNLIRFGGLYPPIHVEADIRRTRLLGATPTYEGGCMLVRARDPIFKMSHLKGKRVGLSKSLNTLKNDWWRVTEHYGILNMLMLNDMSIEDVEIVEFPYADDWYGKPKMLEPLINATELYMGKMDHKRNLAFRPLEAALLDGKVDAIYTHSKTWQHLQEDTGRIAAIEDLSRYPDWRLQANNEPAVITCTAVMAEEHPELVVTFMKAMIKAGRWANDHKRAAAVILKPVRPTTATPRTPTRASSTSIWCRACSCECGRDPWTPCSRCSFAASGNWWPGSADPELPAVRDAHRCQRAGHPGGPR